MSNASARQEPIFPWDREVPETGFWKDIDYKTARTFFLTFSDDEISRMHFDESLTKEEKHKLLRDIYHNTLWRDEQNAAPVPLQQADLHRWWALKFAICSTDCAAGDYASAELAARDMYEHSKVDDQGRENKSGLGMLSLVLEQAGKYAEAEAGALESLNWINGLPKCGPNSPQALGSMRMLIKCVYAQLTAVVQEREAKLRQAMRTMGMMDSAFWLSWATYEAVCDFVTAMLLCAFGAIWQVRS